MDNFKAIYLILRILEKACRQLKDIKDVTPGM